MMVSESDRCLEYVFLKYTLSACRLCQRSLVELSGASCSRYWDNEGVCC